MRSDALTPTLSHERGRKTGHRCDLVPSPQPSPTERGRKTGRRCGLVPSPRPSPTGEEEKRGTGAVWCPHPSPLPRERGKSRAQVRPVALNPALSHWGGGKAGHRCDLMPSPRPSPTGEGEKPGTGAVWCPHPSPLPRGEGDRWRAGGTTSPSPYSPPAAPLTALTCRKSPAVRSGRYGPAQYRPPQRHRCSPAESPPPESTRLFRPDRQASG